MMRLSDQPILGWLWLSVIFAVVAGCASHGSHGKPSADQDRQVKDLQQTVSHLRKALEETRRQCDDLEQLYHSTTLELLTAQRDSRDFESQLRIFHRRCEALDGELASLRELNQTHSEDRAETESRLNQLELENVALSLSATERETVIAQLRQTEADLRTTLESRDEETRSSTAGWEQERSTLVQALEARDRQLKSLNQAKDAQFALLSGGAAGLTDGFTEEDVATRTLKQRGDHHLEATAKTMLAETGAFKSNRASTESTSSRSWWFRAKGAVVVALSSLAVLLEHPGENWPVFFRPVPLLILLTTFGVPVLILISLRRRVRARGEVPDSILDRGVLAATAVRGVDPGSVVSLPSRLPLAATESNFLPGSLPPQPAENDRGISPDSAEDIAATLDAVLGGDPISPQKEPKTVSSEQNGGGEESLLGDLQEIVQKGLG